MWKYGKTEGTDPDNKSTVFKRPGDIYKISYTRPAPRGSTKRNPEGVLNTARKFKQEVSLSGRIIRKNQ